MSRRFTGEQKEFLRSYIPGHHHRDTAEAFNNRFRNTLITENQVKAWASKNKIKCGCKFEGNPSKFSKEVREFINDNYKGIGNKELYQMIVEKFGTGEMTYEQMRSYKKRMHLRSGLTGQFEKGHIPPGKGKTWEEFMPKEVWENCRKNQFKKGNRPANYDAIGTIKITTDGYLRKKVAEPNEWKFLHRLVWEEHNGTVPEGMLVEFKDGNRLNCDISNLMLVSRAENVRLNQSHLRTNDPETMETALLIAKIKTTASKRKRHGTGNNI